MFIRLTDQKDSSAVHLNANHIAAVRPEPNGSLCVLLTGLQYHVKETDAQVVKEADNAERLTFRR